MGAMIYALVTFHWRAQSIRRRGQSGIDDRFGPTILAIALLAAVVVNFILRIRDGQMNQDGSGLDTIVVFFFMAVLDRGFRFFSRSAI